MKKDHRESHQKPEPSRPDRELTEDSTHVLTAENPVESEAPWWRNDSSGPGEVQ